MKEGPLTQGITACQSAAIVLQKWISKEQNNILAHMGLSGQWV
jgi:hypothetical protein